MGCSNCGRECGEFYDGVHYISEHTGKPVRAWCGEPPGHKGDHRCVFGCSLTWPPRPTPSQPKGPGNG